MKAISSAFCRKAAESACELSTMTSNVVAAELVQHVVMQPQQTLSIIEADFPDGRQFETAALLEQRRLNQLLESFHLKADCRLCPSQFLRRTGKAPGVHDGAKGTRGVDG